MNFKFLTIIAGLFFMLTLSFQTASAQTKKESSLISHLVKEANQPDSHSAEDRFLMVRIGKAEFTAELESGKIVGQKRAENASGGFSGAYAEVEIYLLNKEKEITSQGAAQILKLTGTKWKRIALNESDYQCADLKSIPKATLKALNVECN